MAEGYHGVHEKLVDRFSTKGDALYVLFAGFVAIPVNGIATYLLKQPLLLPSLSPAVFTFFMKPLTQQAALRNAVLGHIIVASYLQFPRMNFVKLFGKSAG